jgi:hypothetical protein
MPDILLIFDKSDTDMAEMLQRELEDAFQDSHLDRAFDVAHAKRKLPGTFDLVIATLDLREDRTSALSVDEERGIDLFSWMNSSGIDVPGLLIAPSYTDKLRITLPELGKCYVILSGSAMVQETVRLAKQVAKKDQPKCLDIEIQLRDAGDWTYKISGNGFPVTYAHESVLQIDRRELDDLRTFSGSVATAKNWTDVLHSIGGKLSEVMLRNGGFFGDVVEGLTYAGGEENARVRFTVNPEMHDLALEAVLCPRHEGEHWMLRAPVYRKLLTDNPSTGGCLFQGGARINCLIIEAQTSGLVDDPSAPQKAMLLQPLTTIAKECDWLESFLGKTTATANIGHVERLPLPGDERPLTQQVKEQLEARDWTIVHFAGHSYFSDATRSGYVFMPGVGGKVEKVELERFGDWLLRATFTYFSSCDSGAGPFVFALANRHVPNILGFRWEINDVFALEFSQTFYETLFAGRSLERAFLKAQQKMYETHRDDRIWAAPILVKQLDERDA